MNNTGHTLENFVAQIERTLLPAGMKAEVNQKRFNANGVQIVEFDVVVTGKMGTTDICWLIECRDRPASGSQDSAWIEQLAGRRINHRFHKVTAVSTTGFSPGAVESAKHLGVEIREVLPVPASDMSTWLKMSFIKEQIRIADLININLRFAPGSMKKHSKFFSKLKKTDVDSVLRRSIDDALVPSQDAFLGIVMQQPNIFDDVVANGPSKDVVLDVDFPDHDHYYVQSPAGKLKIEKIIFTGKLSYEESDSPLITSEYRDAATGEIICQSARSNHVMKDGRAVSVSLHNLGEQGTHVTMGWEQKPPPARS